LFWSALEIAKHEFGGFAIRGSGPFAVLDPTMAVVTLFPYRLEAEQQGHVIE
jgi:hypothetical protein